MKTSIFFVTMMALNLAVMAEPLPESIKQGLARSGVGANNELLALTEDQIALYQFVKQSWRDFMPHLNTLNLNPKEQQLLVQASIEALSDQDYLPFVTNALRLFSEGNLSDSIGMALIMPSKSDKEGFLAMNYQNEELADALRAAIPKYSSNPQIQSFAEGILSGSEKDRHVKWMTEQGMQPRAAVATESLPATSEQPWSLEGETSASPARKQHIEPKPASPMDVEESPSPSPSPSLTLTRWSMVAMVAMVVVTMIGLLWVLLKKR